MYVCMYVCMYVIMSEIPLNSSYFQSALIVDDRPNSWGLPRHCQQERVEYSQPAQYAIVSNIVVPSFGAFFIRRK